MKTTGLVLGLATGLGLALEADVNPLLQGTLVVWCGFVGLMLGNMASY